jgi:hypothetical protein
VVGPASATDNAIARFDTTTGKLIQNSVVTVSDTGAINGATTITNIDYIDFDTTYATTLGVGQLGWNGNDTLGLGMIGGNVIQHIGEDQFFYTKATATITKGQVVMFTGAVGASGVPLGAPATGITDGNYIMGVAAENIANNGFGLVQSFGTLRNVNTSGYADGDILWYNPAVTGGLTKTKPVAPNVKAQMAAVINGGSVGGGTILIRISAGSTLGGTDSNAQIVTPTNGQIITYDGLDGYWKNTALTAGTAISVTASSTGVLTVANTAPDQTVALTAGTGISTSGTYPNFTITNTAPSSGGTVTSVGGTGTVNGITLTGTVTTAGNLTLGGTLSGVNLATQVTGTLPVANGGTGITSFGSGVATFLGTPTSANLAAAVTNETGSGALVFATSPTLVTPALGTPASGVVTNLTGTASININGTVGATTANTGSFTTLAASSPASFAAGTALLPAITRTGDTNTGIFFPAADTIAFTENGAESMRIDSSGNLLVGTTTVNGRISSVSKSGFAPNITAGTWASSAGMSSSGSFGGGFSWIDGSGGYCAWAENGGTDFVISGGLTGNVVANGVFLNGFSATSWSARSDERLKQNLKPITDALNKTCSLRAVTGAYKNFPDEQQAFLLAQDVQKVLPEAVCVADKRSSEQYLGLAYTQIIPLLVAAIQELKAEIDLLKGS